jgi:succinate-acetate transporter protein
MATISGQPQAGAPRTAPPATQSAMGGWVPANPAPLGLMAFGATTLVVFDKNLPTVFGMALAFGGLGQLLAGMWEFRTGNTFGAVAFTTYGGFWVSFYFLAQVQLPAIVKGGDAGNALGLYFWAFGIVTALLFLCTFASPRAIQAIFLLLTITFVLLGIGNSGASNSIVHAGGWAGLATAAAAMYTATAEIMAAVHGRDILPIGRPAPRT